MYSKLFRQMYEGTLVSRGPWQALVTFQQLLILSDPVGVVDMDRESISRLTTIPLEVIKIGIEALEMPDPESRTPNSDGRRIVLLNDHRTWGWKIVNFLLYRNLRDAEERREYQRNWINKKRSKDNKVSTLVDNVDQRSTQEAKAKEQERSRKRPPSVETSLPDGPVKTLSGKPDRAAPSVGVVDIFLYWQEVFGHRKSVLDDKRAKLIADRLKEGHSVDQLKAAVLGCSRSKWHAGANDRQTKYHGIHIIFRDAAKVDEFCLIAAAPLPRTTCAL